MVREASAVRVARTLSSERDDRPLVTAETATRDADDVASPRAHSGTEVCTTSPTARTLVDIVATQEPGSKMAFILSSANRTNHLLSYDHDESEDYRSFFAGERLQGCGSINFRLNKKSGIRQISKFHLIASTGPTLFSAKLRALVENVAPDEAEFFDANLSFEDQTVEGFSAVNPLCRVNCVDREKSDFKLTNFDPANPTFQFYFQVLLDEIPSGARIAICNEHRRQIIVGQAIRDACRSLGLEGLSFCRSLDMTDLGRSSCE